MNKELQVKALENGTVIDHIPSDKLFKVVSLLKLDGLKDQITIGNNLSSKQMGQRKELSRWPTGIMPRKKSTASL